MCSHDHFRNIWGCRRSARRPPLAAEGRWVLMGVWKMSLLPIWLTEWLITTRGGEELRRGGALIVMRDRGEALKANQSHRLGVVGGAEASLEDDTSPLPCTGRAHVWHPQTIWSQTDVRISINDTHAHTHIHGGRGDANKVPPITGRRRLWHRWNTGQRGWIGAHAHAHVFMAVIEGNTHTHKRVSIIWELLLNWLIFHFLLVCTT